ncbi:hypothetical protein GCM10025862_07080 [Arsenicicoccus piscis]|uniref:Uncharacterized protein n=1 Tax=Arsenicicoccus piscis TaxID=673954 RepID=A0ABQ6HK02_9MICO|nr:hypothetical protein GCM10025862_07080 [Arsenicicoccus piscis]
MQPVPPGQCRVQRYWSCRRGSPYVGSVWHAASRTQDGSGNETTTRWKDLDMDKVVASAAEAVADIPEGRRSRSEVSVCAGSRVR